MSERGLRASGRRRIIAVAAMGVLAVGALGACRSEPGSAAFVGNSRITNASVETIAKSVSTPTLTAGVSEQNAVSNLVFMQLAQKYAAAKGITLTSKDKLDPEAVSALATSLSVQPDNPYVQTAVAADTWTTELITATPAVKPTDAELMAIYQSAVDAGLAAPGQFAANKDAISQVQDLGKVIGLQRALVAAEKQYDVSINPRYDPACTKAPCPGLSYPLLQLGNSQTGQRFNAVALPLTSVITDPAVLDVATPAATPAAAPSGQ